MTKSKTNAYFERQSIPLANAASDKNAKAFWNMLRSERKPLTSHITPDQWYQHFLEVFNPRNLHEDKYNYDDPVDISDNFLDQRITESEVLRAITCRALKTGKSPGVDGLSIQFIKSSALHLVPPLTDLFNNFYENGYFPPEWATSILAPIHKKGNIDDPNNYRGLLPEISKIFTSVISNRFKVWYDRNEKIGEEQAGFRKDHSTTDNIFILHTLITKYLRHKGGRPLPCYICGL